MTNNNNFINLKKESLIFGKSNIEKIKSQKILLLLKIIKKLII